MDHSMAQAGPRPLVLPQWKTALSAVSAILLALLFLVAGIWKVTDPLSAAARMTQALIPSQLSLATAISAGVFETFAGVLLLVPRFRRWGAWLTGLMLIAFLVYIGWNYNALRGEECNCFPWLKRAVGPGFFISDIVMLLMAVAAGYWGRESAGTRSAGIILATITVFALASYGFAVARNTGLQAPDSLIIDGKPRSIQQGKVFLYFFDPECAHCWKAAQAMSQYKWNATEVVVVPTRVPQYTQQFLSETGLKAKVTSDVDLLRKTFQFGDPPYAVALEHGRQKAALAAFDDREPVKTLRDLGYIE
ncbi:MAG: DoxX family protein [Bryobacteraceae bacterium]|nr:DoxX family protein [Bryobacteraceae bacterium]